MPDIELDCRKVFADHFLLGSDHDLLAHGLKGQFEIGAHRFAGGQNDSFVLHGREVRGGSSNGVGAWIQVHEAIIAAAIGRGGLLHTGRLVLHGNARGRHRRSGGIGDSAENGTVSRLGECRYVAEKQHGPQAPRQPLASYVSRSNNASSFSLRMILVRLLSTGKSRLRESGSLPGRKMTGPCSDPHQGPLHLSVLKNPDYR